MEQYLSIGEIAKARGVNVQSLRYYEKLGILIPAYVNPENGYRYYSLEQIMILDTIILCVDLGIPLKDLKNYVDEEGQLKFEQLLKDGKRLARKKIRSIEENLQSINHTLLHVQSQKSFLGKAGYYTRYIFPRSVITIPCEQTPDAKRYEKCLSALFDIARRKNLRASFPHGIISHYRKGQYTGSDMFLEVLPGESTMITKIQEGNYLCFQEKRETHSNPAAIFASCLTGTYNADILVSSMSPSTYRYDDVILEFQLAVPR